MAADTTTANGNCSRGRRRINAEGSGPQKGSGLEGREELLGGIRRGSARRSEASHAGESSRAQEPALALETLPRTPKKHSWLVAHRHFRPVRFDPRLSASSAAAVAVAVSAPSRGSLLLLSAAVHERPPVEPPRHRNSQRAQCARHDIRGPARRPRYGAIDE